MSTAEPKVIHDSGETPFVLYSQVSAPLAGLSFLRRALALAELAMIAYNDEDEAQAAAREIGFSEAHLFEYDGSEAYLFRNKHDVVLACRGTEPTEWNDIAADANAVLSAVGSLGRVHSGFNQEVDDLWPVLEEELRENRKPVWFCGHSLGAAMATICAFRCKTSWISSNPQELHTFGSPRVGCKRYVRHAAVQHYRWVHNNDVVTQVPPTWLGYRHGGNEIYLDRKGRIRKLKGLRRIRDRWRGLLAGLMGWQFDLLTDHSIGLYAQHIARAAEKEGGVPTKSPGSRDDRALRVDSLEATCPKPALIQARRRYPLGEHHVPAPSQGS